MPLVTPKKLGSLTLSHVVIGGKEKFDQFMTGS